MEFSLDLQSIVLCEEEKHYYSKAKPAKISRDSILNYGLSCNKEDSLPLLSTAVGSTSNNQSNSVQQLSLRSPRAFLADRKLYGVKKVNVFPLTNSEKEIKDGEGFVSNDNFSCPVRSAGCDAIETQNVVRPILFVPLDQKCQIEQTQLDQSRKFSAFPMRPKLRKHEKIDTDAMLRLLSKTSKLPGVINDPSENKPHKVGGINESSGNSTNIDNGNANKNPNRIVLDQDLPLCNVVDPLSVAISVDKFGHIDATTEHRDKISTTNAHQQNKTQLSSSIAWKASDIDILKFSSGKRCLANGVNSNNNNNNNEVTSVKPSLKIDMGVESTIHAADVVHKLVATIASSESKNNDDLHKVTKVWQYNSNNSNSKHRRIQPAVGLTVVANVEITDDDRPHQSPSLPLYSSYPQSPISTSVISTPRSVPLSPRAPDVLSPRVIVSSDGAVVSNGGVGAVVSNDVGCGIRWHDNLEIHKENDNISSHSLARDSLMHSHFSRVSHYISSDNCNCSNRLVFSLDKDLTKTVISPVNRSKAVNNDTPDGHAAVTVPNPICVTASGNCYFYIDSKDDIVSPKRSSNSNTLRSPQRKTQQEQLLGYDCNNNITTTAVPFFSRNGSSSSSNSNSCKSPYTNSNSDDDRVATTTSSSNTITTAAAATLSHSNEISIGTTTSTSPTGQINDADSLMKVSEDRGAAAAAVASVTTPVLVPHRPPPIDVIQIEKKKQLRQRFNQQQRLYKKLAARYQQQQQQQPPSTVSSGISSISAEVKSPTAASPSIGTVNVMQVQQQREQLNGLVQTRSRGRRR